MRVRKALFARGLDGSCVGTKSRSDVFTSDVVLVERKFWNCMRRCPLLVAIDFVRCLVMREVVRPGHEEKCPRRMARTKVEGTGLKATA